MNTPEILDLARARAGLPSDRKLAKALGMPAARVSQFRTGTRKLDGKTAVKIAELLGEPPAYVLALVAAERADDDGVAREWRRAAKLLKRVGVAAIAAVVLGLSSPPQAGATGQRVSQGDELYIMRARRRRPWFTPARAFCTRRRRSRQRQLFAHTTIAP